MDGLPLLALCTKWLKQLFDIEWNYLGIWLGLCYALQGMSAVVLLMALQVRGWVPVIDAANCGVNTGLFDAPIHPTLCGHFLILLALALCFAAKRSSSSARVWPWFCVLAWVALLVQAYFFVMIGGTTPSRIAWCPWPTTVGPST